MRKGTLLAACAAAIALSGCMSFGEVMVNRDGQVRNCGTKGGGFGLGFVVGAGAAAASSHDCALTAEQAGYIRWSEAGKLQPPFGLVKDGQVTRFVAKGDGSNGVRKGDELLSMGGITVEDYDTLSQDEKLKRARELTRVQFGPKGEDIPLKLRRDGEVVLLTVKRDPMPSMDELKVAAEKRAEERKANEKRKADEAAAKVPSAT
ncbi:hypothetical protein [Cupriavidus malaysiensis]|uniref:hypothetical protein n=1 Tax=Cupriavidus malaysiensis TaxID=367825 RepID=UPI0012FF8219|nr:hypothetical protein [Cupriavidus malaysiensis]